MLILPVAPKGDRQSGTTIVITIDCGTAKRSALWYQKGDHQSGTTIVITIDCETAKRRSPVWYQKVDHQSGIKGIRSHMRLQKVINIGQFS